MKHIAYVLRNNPEDAPVAGAIQVICPTLYGFIEGTPEGISNLDRLRYGKQVNEWIFPLVQNTNDIIIPDLGDIVVVEQLEGSTLKVWSGFIIPSQEYINPFIKKNGTYSQEMPSTDVNLEIDKGNSKTRVLGTKSGSAIVFTDTWVKERDSNSDRESKLKIVAGGKTYLYENREGVSIEMDATNEEEKFILVVQNADGSQSQTVVIDNDTKSIEITDYEGQTFIMDAENKSIQITDAEGQTFTLDANNKKIEMVDSNSQKITLDGNSQEVVVSASDSRLIKMTSSDTTIQDSDNTSIVMGSSGVVIESMSKKIELGSASIKLTGTMGSLEVM